MYLLKNDIIFKERSSTEADSSVVLITGFHINLCNSGSITILMDLVKF